MNGEFELRKSAKCESGKDDSANSGCQLISANIPTGRANQRIVKIPEQ